METGQGLRSQSPGTSVKGRKHMALTAAKYSAMGMQQLSHKMNNTCRIDAQHMKAKVLKFKIYMPISVLAKLFCCPGKSSE
jgi:hypothetical protein